MGFKGSAPSPPNLNLKIKLVYSSMTNGKKLKEANPFFNQICQRPLGGSLFLLGYLLFFGIFCEDRLFEVDFNLSISHTFLSTEESHFALALDYDLDGDWDLFIANTGQDYLLENRAANESVSDPGALFINRTSTHLPDITLLTREAHLVDFNNDDYMDILCISDGPNYFLQNNAGNGFIQVLDRFDPGNADSRGAEVFDINMDEHLDLLIANYARECSQIWINNGAGYYTEASSTLFNDYDAFCRSQITDISAGDYWGFLPQNTTILEIYPFSNDILLSSSNIDFPYFWFNDFGANFFFYENELLPVCYQIKFQTMFADQIYQEDLNKDGLIDIIFVNYWRPNDIYNTQLKYLNPVDCEVYEEEDLEELESYFSLYLLEYNATGFATAADDFSYSGTLTDINGDDWMDILIANGGQSRLFLNNEGTMIDRTDKVLPLLKKTTHHIGAGDWDLDGDVDLFYANDGENYLLLNSFNPLDN